MVLIATFLSATQWVTDKRTDKPFNSILGETFELVTDKFKYYGENVSSNPPVQAFNGQGEGFEVSKNVNTKVFFTGSKVKAIDDLKYQIKLFCGDTIEEYEIEVPSMVIGNLVS